MSVINRHLRVVAQEMAQDVDLKNELERVYAHLEEVYYYADELSKYIMPYNGEVAKALGTARNYVYSALDSAMGMYKHSQKVPPTEIQRDKVADAKKVLEGVMKSNAILKHAQRKLAEFKSKVVNVTHVALVDQVNGLLAKAEEQFTLAHSLLVAQ